MAQISKRLLGAIAEKKGVLPKNVYPMVNAVSREMFLGRDLAALVVASRLHININKFATAAQLDALRGQLGGGRAAPASIPAAPAVSASPSSRRSAPVARAVKPKPKDNSVFVIHGRDLSLRDSMFALLSALGCKPLEFHQAVASVRGTSNPWVGVVLDKVFEKAQALIVLLSPDDEAKLQDHFVKSGEKNTEGKLKGQARANVIYEAGMAMARHQEKTIMVQVGTIKSFSDIFGRHMLHLNNSFASRNDFVGRLENICTVDRTGNRWAEVGDFKPASAKAKAKKIKKTKAKRA